MIVAEVHYVVPLILKEKVLEVIWVALGVGVEVVRF